MDEIRLAKAPPHDTRGPFSWGSWDGALAIVELLDDRFDPDTCERLYAVRFATVGGKHPVPSIPDYDLGMPVNVARPDLPYTETTFKLGIFGNRRHIPLGGFTAAVRYRVPTTLREMTDAEHRALRRLLSDRHVVDARETKLTPATWRRLFERTFAEVQAGPVEEANEADRILVRMGVDTCDDAAASAGWRSLRERGLFTEARNGRIKWIVPGKEGNR